MTKQFINPLLARLNSYHYNATLLWQNLLSLNFSKRQFIDDAELMAKLKTADNVKSQCDDLVLYLSQAFKHYATSDYSHAYYLGLPSQQGKKIDAMEAVSRFLPTLVTYYNHRLKQSPDHTENAQVNDTFSVNVPDLLKSCFLAGTNPNSRSYWGSVDNYDQRICESADLALVLWLSKDYFWNKLNLLQQQQILAWFEPICKLKTADNNWLLFTLTVQFVLTDLTAKNQIDMSLFQRIKTFLVGDGWFKDGDKGCFDYYNAWGFHYSLYWLEQINPGFSNGFVREQLALFTNNYRHFFTSDGLPLFGRSGCYRLAVSAPLLAAIDLGTEQLSIGEAKRAFSTSLKFFINNQAIENGVPSQGVFQTDHRWFDNYSGGGSSFWSLRAINIAYYCGERINLWNAEESALMVEKEDFNLDIPSIGAKLQGNKASNEVIIEFYHMPYDMISSELNDSEIKGLIQQQSHKDRLLEVLLGRARRPDNNLLKKGVYRYSSKMNYYHL